MTQAGERTVGGTPMMLRAQTILTATNGGATRIKRNVTHYRKGTPLEGMEYGRITLYGGIYRVARALGKTCWEVREHLTIYPAGHPLACLNPKD